VTLPRLADGAAVPKVSPSLVNPNELSPQIEGLVGDQPLAQDRPSTRVSDERRGETQGPAS
jgi:hypothetical protein